MIRFKGVKKIFPGKTAIHALRGITLDIPAGEIFGIMGQSGAGKSTLIRCVNMLERPDQGQVWVDGVLMNDLCAKQLRQERKKMGMIFQHFNLFNSRTVFGNVAFPLEIAGEEKNKIKSKVKSLLDLVDLADKTHAYPNQLSGGQKQRVGIARALATEPRLILCDEATSALDPKTTKSVLQLLQKINNTLGLTIVLVTHEMAAIQEICDQVAVLDDGLLQEAGPVLDVFTRPRSGAAKRMLQGFLAPRIPAQLQNSHNKLLHLTFIDQGAHQPIISQMIRGYQVDANILFGRIDHMKTTPFGMLLVELSGTAEQIKNSVEFLRNNRVEVEVLN